MDSLTIVNHAVYNALAAQSPQQIARKASYALSATSSMYPLIAAFCHVQAAFMLIQQPNIAWLVLEDAPSVLQET